MKKLISLFGLFLVLSSLGCGDMGSASSGTPAKVEEGADTEARPKLPSKAAAAPKE